MNLKLLRKNNAMTQEDIAKILNTSQQTYARYELETSEPTIDTLVRLADFYDVSLDYLVNRPYNDGLGYLDNEQKECCKNIKKLTRINLMKVSSYILGILAMQE